MKAADFFAAGGMVKLVEYEATRMPALARAYASATAATPFCASADGGTEQWAEELRTLPKQMTAAGTRSCSWRRIWLALSDESGGEVLGFVDACVRPARAGKEWRSGSTHAVVDIPRTGLIRFLWHEPGHREAGVALLDVAEQHLRDKAQVSDVYAFDQAYRYRFYMMSSAYLSQTAHHIHALLGTRDYERCNGECYYRWAGFEITAALAPSLPPGVRYRVELVPGRGRLPGTKVFAVSEETGKDLGVCVTISGAEFSVDSSHATDYEAASRLAFVTWLGVPVVATANRLHPSQGQGLGKALLAEGLKQMQFLGYRDAAISTAEKNYKAQVFYANYGGFSLVDWTWGLKRRQSFAPTSDEKLRASQPAVAASL